MAKIKKNVVFGIHSVNELIQKRRNEIESIYIKKETSEELFEIVKRCRKLKIKCNLVPIQKIDNTSGVDNHQGIVAVCSLKPFLSVKKLKKMVKDMENPLIILPASVSDTGNLGAIIRSAVAFNAVAIVLERNNTAPLNAQVAKTSVGMLEHIEVVKPSNLAQMLSEFKDIGFQIIGTEMNAEEEIQDVDFKRPTILVLGGEHQGIPKYIRKALTQQIKIPMNDQAESLNVSVAASICLFEAFKQKM